MSRNQTRDEGPHERTVREVVELLSSAQSKKPGNAPVSRALAI